MPRYYFRLQDGGTVQDPDGEILENDAEARVAAVEVFAETLTSKVDHICDGGAYEIQVSREDDGPIFSIVAQGRDL